MKKRRYAKIPKAPKAVLGALLGTGVSVVTGLIGQAKQEKLQKEQEEKAKNLQLASNLQADRVALQDFDSDGVTNVDYYAAKGGLIKAPSYASKGGKLVPMSSDMEIAKGNKHNESKIDGTSGIKLFDEQGNNFVEIEDDEVIKDGQKVYSNKLKTKSGRTYADEVELLAKKKAKIENNTGLKTNVKLNTDKANLAKLDYKEDLLFKEQESKKVNNNSKKMEKGGFFELAMPFVDNVSNAILTANSPSAPKPTILNPARLKTKINVNPQINDTTRAVEAASENIKNNSSNSNSARAGITKARLEGNRQKSAIRANKENTETQLENRNSLNAQQVNARNLAAVDRFNQQEMNIQDDVQGRISANVNNAVEDVAGIKNRKNAEKYNEDYLNILKRMYNQGTTRRDILSDPTEIAKMKSDKDYAATLLEDYKGTKEELELKKILGIPYFNENTMNMLAKIN